LPTTSEEALRLLVEGRQTPSALRAAAADQLNLRNALTTASLQRLLATADSVESVFAWLHEPASSVTIAQVVEVVTGADDLGAARTDLVARLRAELSDTSELKLEFESEKSLSSWDALSWKSDHELVPLAREIFDTDAPTLIEPLLDNPEWSERDDLIPVVRARCRCGALRILMEQDAVEEEDIDRVRQELSSDSMYSRSDALRWLAAHATVDDIPLMREYCDVYDDASLLAVATILRLGGANAARGLIASDRGDHALLAVRALAELEETTADELRELLYSSKDTIRIAALDGLMSRLDDDALSALLREYPKPGRSYYYNVVCELDRRLHAPVVESEQPPSRNMEQPIEPPVNEPLVEDDKRVRRA
jgi:hypothetical protein